MDIDSDPEYIDPPPPPEPPAAVPEGDPFTRRIELLPAAPGPPSMP